MGFRDPYVIETGGSGRNWRIVLGSGIAGAGGSLLVYSSPELTSGADRYMDAVFILINTAATLVHTRAPTRWQMMQMVALRRVDIRWPAVRVRAARGGRSRHRRHVGVPLPGAPQRGAAGGEWWARPEQAINSCRLSRAGCWRHKHSGKSPDICALRVAVPTPRAQHELVSVLAGRIPGRALQYRCR